MKKKEARMGKGREGMMEVRPSFPLHEKGGKEGKRKGVVLVPSFPLSFRGGEERRE